MTISKLKTKRIEKEERKLPLANAEDMLGGIKVSVMNYTKKGEPRYCIKVCGSKPETKTYMSRIDFLKELEKRI